jgi:signal transduction histidine kinase
MTGATRGPGRVAAVLGGAGLTLTLLAVAFAVATSRSTEQIAADALALHWANATSGSSAVARAGVSQAVVFGVANDLGLADRAAVEEATAEAMRTIEDLERWLSAATDGDANLAAARSMTDELSEFITAAEATVRAVADGDTAAAEAHFHDDLEEVYLRLSSDLDEAQSALAGQITATKRHTGTVGLVTQILATLLIPAAAIVIYFLFARRQYREASVRMEAKLAAERRLSMAKDEFIAGVSHELRTPLTGIYGFSEYLIEQGIVDPDEAMELIGHINHEAAELWRMVEDLLSAARIDSDALVLDMAPTEVGAEVLAVAAPMQRAGATITVDSDPMHAVVDPIRLRQIIRNLLSNAVKHGGSQIRVSVGGGEDHVVITVADDGDGVPEPLQDRLFGRFVHDGSESLLNGSVGLGLSIARSLAQRMGGDIDHVRAIGWTNFVVTLPRSDVDVEPDDELPPILRLDQIDGEDMAGLDGVDPGTGGRELVGRSEEKDRIVRFG